MRLRRRNRILYARTGLLLLLLAAVGLNMAFGIDPKVRIGIEKGMMPALCIIADEKGFFAQTGLNVSITEFDSGKLALAALFEGNVDMATAGETPVCMGSFQRQDFSIVTTIATADNEPAIIARKDRGITKAIDLKNKRVATQQGSAVHFFLHLFLLKNGLSENDVKLIYLKPEEMPEALLHGDIDAFSMREPFIRRAEGVLGQKTVVFRSPGLYQKFMNIVAMKGFIDGKQDSVKRILKSLIEAEGYAKKHPDEVAKIMAQRLGEGDQTSASALKDMVLQVGLDQSLLLFMEDEARWAVKTGLVKNRTIPNMLNIISLDNLLSLKPSVVMITK